MSNFTELQLRKAYLVTEESRLFAKYLDCPPYEELVIEKAIKANNAALAQVNARIRALS
mgnify:CR=1 FL=1